MSRAADPNLQIVTIRLLRHDIQEAQRAAKADAIPYQHVIRKWVKDGAEAARAARKAKRS